MNIKWRWVPARLFLPLFGIVTLCYTTAYTQSVSLSVLSYNIRLVTPDDAPNIWQNRKNKVFDLIRISRPDVFGLQEAVSEQVQDMEKAFPEYTRVGVGRDDGKEAGEYSPLFFSSNKLSLLNSGTFWLSQTPNVAGSRGWDAACNRIVTWVNLKEIKSGKEVFVFCTHFDHMGTLARKNSAELLLHAIDSLAGKHPIVVLGDFNSTPDSEPFKIISNVFDSRHLIDSKSVARNVKGPDFTYTGFKVGGFKGERIDYIFLKGIKVVSTFEVNDTNNGEYYPSDHLPVNAMLYF